MKTKAPALVAAASLGLIVVIGEALWLTRYLATSLQPEEHIGGWFLIGGTLVLFAGLIARLARWRHGRRLMVVAAFVSLVLGLFAYAILTRW